MACSIGIFVIMFVGISLVNLYDSPTKMKILMLVDGHIFHGPWLDETWFNCSSKVGDWCQERAAWLRKPPGKLVRLKLETLTWWNRAVKKIMFRWSNLYIYIVYSIMHAPIVYYVYILCIYVYMYMYICICIYIYMYDIYMHNLRKPDSQRKNSQRHRPPKIATNSTAESDTHSATQKQPPLSWSTLYLTVPSSDMENQESYSLMDRSHEDICSGLSHGSLATVSDMVFPVEKTY